MEGTVRTLSLDLRDMIPVWIEDTIKGVTSAYGARYEFSFKEGNPPVINDRLTTRFTFSMLKDLLVMIGLLSLKIQQWVVRTSQSIL